jgi:hypothetical protein
MRIQKLQYMPYFPTVKASGTVLFYIASLVRSYQQHIRKKTAGRNGAIPSANIAV